MVAPGISAPSASQRTATLVGVGVQAPVSTESGAPTAGVPEMTGGVVGSTTRSLKWMKPLGQPPPVFVTRRQWKSPPQ